MCSSRRKNNTFFHEVVHNQGQNVEKILFRMARKAEDLLPAQDSNWPYGLVGKAPV